MKKSLVLALVFIMAFCLFGCNKTVPYKRIASPTGFTPYVKENKTLVDDGTFYVSASGDDSGSGSKSDPFATIEKARDEVRVLIAANTLPVGGAKVVVMAGEYNINNIEFGEADSGTAEKPITYVAYGDGEVILNGGKQLLSSDFEAVSAEEKSRLNPEIADKIRCVDLSKYGITAQDYGKLYSLGGFKTEYKYTDVMENPPVQCELFFNDERMTLARYPNGDNLKLGEVSDIGDCYEPKPQDYRPEWHDMINPRGGTFGVDKTTAARMKTWKNLKDIWLFGYFYWDWADMSTPISAFNADKNDITTKYCSKYGFKEGADYYFYNVFEELDTEGEWYLDRDNGILYLYPTAEMADSDIQISLTTESVIEVNDAEYLIFDGFTVKGSRENGYTVKGDNCVVRNSTVKNIAKDGVVVDGKNNTVERTDVSQIGSNGIVLKGGDRAVLTPSGNVAKYNDIYRIGELQRTYIAGISLHGVGAAAINNDIHDTPHMAIFYEGNDHTMAYNRIYDAVKYSSDAGAIYAGRNLSYYGNKIYYNCIYNLGADKFNPAGIYFDDALSGQTAYGNLLVNIPSMAILIGGGRDCVVTNNMIINAGIPIHFDSRAYDGANSNGWYKDKVNEKNGSFWTLYEEAKALNEGWGHKYDGIDIMTRDFSEKKQSSFAVNPSGSVVSNNIIVAQSKKLGYIGKGAKKYATIENNSIYALKDFGFNDFAGGNYSLKSDGKITKENPSFKPIPFEKIGRGGNAA